MVFLSMGCMSCLYVCLYAQFEILQTTCCLRVVHALSRRKDLISPFSFLSPTHSHSTIIAVGSMQQKDLSLSHFMLQIGISTRMTYLYHELSEL
jgi:hypothetical protein